MDDELSYVPSPVYRLVCDANPSLAKLGGPKHFAKGALLDESDFHVPRYGRLPKSSTRQKKAETSAGRKNMPFRVLDKTATSHFRNSKHYADWEIMKERRSKAIVETQLKSDGRLSPELDQELCGCGDTAVTNASGGSSFNQNEYESSDKSKRSLGAKIHPRVFYRKRHFAGRIFTGDEEQVAPKRALVVLPQKHDCPRCDTTPCKCCERCIRWPWYSFGILAFCQHQFECLFFSNACL